MSLQSDDERCVGGGCPPGVLPVPSPTIAAPASNRGTETPPHESARPHKRAVTAVWGIVGLLCSAGVILAVLDPSLAGGSSGASSTGAPYEAVSDDDGFVPPPALPPVQAKQALPPVCEPGDQSEHSARLALADAQIAKLLEKLRMEREARTAAKKKARHKTSR